MVEIAAVSWILELPQDLGLPEDSFSAVVAAGELPEGWSEHPECVPGWSDHELTALFDRRIRFRRVQVHLGMPTASTDLAFGDLKAYTGRGRRRYHRNLKKMIKKGVYEWKTVCQLTRWYVGADIPDPPADRLDPEPDSVIRSDFYELLNDLDTWLQQYGLASGNFNVGSVSLHDLPATIPWLVEARSSPLGSQVAMSGMLPIHGKVPNLMPVHGDEDAAKSAAVAMAKPEDLPFFLPSTLLFQAQSHALAGRSRAALIDVGTSVESMASIVIRHALEQRGRALEADQVLNRRWKDVFNRELLEALSVELGKGPGIHSRWWSTHYRNRNEAVHSGMRLSRDEAFQAVDDTWTLFAWIGDQMRASPDLAGLGRQLVVLRR